MHARAEKIRKSKIAARPPKTFLNLFVDKCRRRPPPGEGAVRARARARALSTQDFCFPYFLFCVYHHLRVTNFETECWLFQDEKKIQKFWKIPPNFPLGPPPCLFVLSYDLRRCPTLLLILTLKMGGSFWEDFFLETLQPNWSVKTTRNYLNLFEII